MILFCCQELIVFWGETARELKYFGNGVGFHSMETVSINWQPKVGTSMCRCMTSCVFVMHGARVMNGLSSIDDEWFR